MIGEYKGGYWIERVREDPTIWELRSNELLPDHAVQGSTDAWLKVAEHLERQETFCVEGIVGDPRGENGFYIGWITEKLVEIDGFEVCMLYKAIRENIEAVYDVGRNA